MSGVFVSVAPDSPRVASTAVPLAALHARSAASQDQGCDQSCASSHPVTSAHPQSGLSGLARTVFPEQCLAREECGAGVRKARLPPPDPSSRSARPLRNAIKTRWNCLNCAAAVTPLSTAYWAPHCCGLHCGLYCNNTQCQQSLLTFRS